MVLIEKSGQIYINEQAREKLKALWPAAYESNMKQLMCFARKVGRPFGPERSFRLYADNSL